MNYYDATKEDKGAMDAACKLYSLGYLLQHIDAEQMQNDKPLSMDILLTTIAETGEMICRYADNISCYLCDLNPAR